MYYSNIINGKSREDSTGAKGAEAFELATVMLEILNQKKPRFIFVKINRETLLAQSTVNIILRACLHGGGRPQAGKVTGLGGVTQLSI